ncbi:MAG: MFS transporter [Burkholderiales bacterium]|nr:MFS transporter [Burkholderiales bacterium]
MTQPAADAAPLPAPARHSAWRLLAYGGLGLPLAMAALPIYVHVPKFYADTLGLSLASIGFLLLLARAFDAIQDPLLGYWSDRTRQTGRGRGVWIGVGAPLLALGMIGLFVPPELSTTGLSIWLVAMLLVVYTAYSMITISYQAHGAEMSADPNERTRIVSFREGLGLIGVFLAAALPEILSKLSGARAGFAQFSYLFGPLIVILALVMMRSSPPAVTTHVSDEKRIFAVMLKPFGNASFRPLLWIFVMNGIAASIPATLVLFFIEDAIQRPDLTAQFLIAYFAAGAAGMPLWVKLSSRIGKGRAWFCGMILSIAAFVWAFLLGPGDATAFFIICIMSGLGLGADLALPPSILADVIDIDERAGKGRNEGAYFGLWNLVTKGNLALAAGVALPLLGWLGYAPKGSHSTEVLTALAAVYALLPCMLKAVAALLLWRSPFFDSPQKDPS